MDEASYPTADLVTADASQRVLGPVGGILLVVAGLAGIITSWNAFLVGGSRAIWALANAGLLPAGLGRLHPKYNTPHNAILLIGILSAVAPFFGRSALVWLVDAGGLGIVVAYGMVALSFIVLRQKEPDLARPYKTANGRIVGILAIILAAGLGALYLPFSPAALILEEWVIVLGWAVAGTILFLIADRSASL